MARCRTCRLKIAVCMALLLLIFSQTCGAYSVMSHEALIDSAWDTAIKPLLLKRFPDATPDQLREAHSYAWGGAVIQDMGYYPFGSKLFSDLTHYVRSGDFVEALIRDSQISTNTLSRWELWRTTRRITNGHRVATNKAVPTLFPKLREKYGDVVVYDENPAVASQDRVRIRRAASGPRALRAR